MVLVSIGVVKLGFGVVDLEKKIVVILMAPKKRTKLEAGSSSQGYDGRSFANAARCEIFILSASVHCQQVIR